MKFSIFKNDKTTIKDEVALTLITLISAFIGIVLVINRPTIWIFNSTMCTTTGVLFLLLAVMYIPCIIYRFFTNDKNIKSEE